MGNCGTCEDSNVHEYNTEVNLNKKKIMHENFQKISNMP
jgi:hypothetical protein